MIELIINEKRSYSLVDVVMFIWAYGYFYVCRLQGNAVSEQASDQQREGHDRVDHEAGDCVGGFDGSTSAHVEVLWR